MTTIVTRAGKGSALTHNEVDANFTNLNSAKYESGNNVTLGTISGTTITASTAFSGALNGTVGATTPAAGTFTSLSDSGNLTFTGTGNRITGDFSNATAANRVSFQSSTTNGATIVNLLPNGTGTAAQLIAYSSADPTNSSFGQFRIGTDVNELRISSGILGTGTYLPMTFHTGGSERMRIDTSGNVGIGTSSPSARLTVDGAVRIFGTTTSGYRLYINPNTLVTDVYAAGTDTVINTVSNGSLNFGTNNTERMRIDSSGNVGIGTVSPGEFKLNVLGSLISSYSQINSRNTTIDFVGMSITNQRSTGGVSFIDAQGINSATDSHMFFTHGADFSSAVSFATQPAGTNTDRRVTRLFISASGDVSPAADNAYSLGVNGGRWSAIWAANGTIQTSDARKKTEILNSVLGLDFINQLRPVSYKWIEGGKTVESTTTYDEEGNPVFNTVESSVAGTRRHFGLLAQEVKEVIPEGVDFGGWLLTDKNDENSDQALRYDEFISPLIKAIQELTAKVEVLQSELNTLKGN
jgi:hypothetical protein